MFNFTPPVPPRAAPRAPHLQPRRQPQRPQGGSAASGPPPRHPAPPPRAPSPQGSSVAPQAPRSPLAPRRPTSGGHGRAVPGRAEPGGAAALSALRAPVRLGWARLALDQIGSSGIAWDRAAEGRAAAAGRSGAGAALRARRGSGRPPGGDRELPDTANPTSAHREAAGKGRRREPQGCGRIEPREVAPLRVGAASKQDQGCCGSRHGGGTGAESRSSCSAVPHAAQLPPSSKPTRFSNETNAAGDPGEVAVLASLPAAAWRGPHRSAGAQPAGGCLAAPWCARPAASRAAMSICACKCVCVYTYV